MTYPEAIENLFSLQFFGIKLGLDNIRVLCKHLGNPQDKFDSIHVAGTNGKGTVCALMASALSECEYKTGLYTSPHLIDFCERIQIDGRQIPPEFVVEFTEKVWTTVTEHKMTFFEVTTAMAFAWFAEQGVDVAVIETGMGGRLDATNVLHPALSVITPVGMDHQAYLGSTIEEIAAEKAGIIKDYIPVVMSEMDSAAQDVIRKTAEACHSPVIFSKTVAPILGQNIKASGSRFTVSLECQEVEFTIPLPGEHQVSNAIIALAALQHLRNDGYHLSAKGISAGFANTNWPARFQVIPGNPTMVLDVGHNPAGARKLVQTFQDCFPNKAPLWIVGMMKDKDVMEYLRALKTGGGRLIATRPSQERAMSVEELAGLSRFKETDSQSSVRSALEHAKSTCRIEEVVVLCGSFFTVGEAMTLLETESFAN